MTSSNKDMVPIKFKVLDFVIYAFRATFIAGLIAVPLASGVLEYGGSEKTAMLAAGVFTALLMRLKLFESPAKQSQVEASKPQVAANSL